MIVRRVPVRRFSEETFHPRPPKINRQSVSHLRLLSSPPPQVSPDEACLEAFLRELDYVHRTLRRLGTASSETDDLAQEVFLVLRKCWSAYDSERPLRPYLFGIAFRIAAAHHRKHNREVAYEIVEVSDSGPGPDDALQTKQARALVLAALEHIPLPRRAVLLMHDLDEIPVEEVASALGIPKFTVYSRLRKARREMENAVRRLTKARTL
jgi:RNA polymerase sigma-70 factor (ECF subfamily)